MDIIKLATTRLTLIALDQSLIELMVRDRKELETELGLEVTDDMNEPASGFYQRILNAITKEPHEYPWLTDWQIVLKSENRTIGGFTFKRSPSLDGFVEIGYGLTEKYWGKGYATEAICAALDWARSQLTLRVVVAKTAKSNDSSMRVLEKAGFTPCGEDTEHYLWRLHVR